MNEEKVCCICNEHKKFLARINAGQKLYCMQCEAKITKEYGKDYWKPCSFGDFFESWSKEINATRKKGNIRTSNMFTSIRETLRKIDEENNEK